MDLVYILGTGSRWGNNELRYSLRSIEKYLKHKNIFLIGEKPEWAQNLTHIPAIDPYPMNKERNIFSKIMVACKDSRVTEDFLFINDDHFLLQPMKDIPYYGNGTIEQFLKRRVTTYTMSAYNTKKALQAKSLPTNYFDIHAPIIYNKQKFLELQAYDWNIKKGYVIKSLYCNTHNIAPVPYSDCKLQIPTNEEAIKEKIKGRAFFSIGDGAINTNLRNVMEELYPEKSSYEL